MQIAFDPRTASPNLYSARLKVSRAKKHLDSLGEEISRFREDTPYEIRGYDDFEAQEYVISIQFNGLPASIGLILGDVVSCLRSSLDHVAYALASQASARVSRCICFPIVGIFNHQGRRDFERSTVGISPDAVAIIKSLQPYNSGKAFESHKLWQLHSLWNIDKHRQILFQVTEAEIKIARPPNVSPVKRVTDIGAEYRFPLALKAYVKLHPVIQMDLLFGEPSEGIAVRIMDLLHIYKFVSEDVLPKFKRFF